MIRVRLLIALSLIAACSKKTPEQHDEPTPAAPRVVEHADAAAESKPANRLDYDLPMVADHKGGFDVSFALLHLGREDTGQGDLVLFGPEIKPGDKGGASDWNDICDTRLNAFPYARVHGFRIYISNIKQLPAAPAKLDANNTSFDLEDDSWALADKDLRAHPFQSDVRLVRSDGKEADVEIRIVEPGKDGSLRGSIRAKICPPAQ